MNTELESIRAEIRALRAEIEQRSKADADRERRIDVLYSTIKDMAEAFQKLYGSVVALQNAVEAIGLRKN
jgi:hypothetical protein